MLKKLFTLMLVLGAVQGTLIAGVQDSLGVTKISNKLHVRYMVEPSETLYGISTKYGISADDLIEINPELEYGLKVGQIINIPYNPESIARSRKVEPKSDNKVYHKVQPGDTYYSLARKYNTTLDQLLKWNNMELKAGQEIVVGDSSQTTATSATTTPTNTTPTNTTPTNTTTTVTTPPVNTTPTNTTTTTPKNTNTQTPVVKAVDSVKVVAGYEPYPFNPDFKQVLVIPFDPYLYFSDADDEIAARSNMMRTKVRQVFRRRLNALIDARGYETIHLLGGDVKDSISDLNKIYTGVNYSYMGELKNDRLKDADAAILAQQKNNKATPKEWINKQKDKVQGNSMDAYDQPNENEKYFGVTVKNPELFEYFNNKYSVDYYVFVTQFEVKTNYEHCLDRSAGNYERTFTTHYCIFDNKGNRIAGEQFQTHYNSNANYIMTIVADNMPKVVDRIMIALPPPNYTAPTPAEQK